MRTPLLRISPGSCLLVAVGLIAHPAAAAPTATPNTVTFCLNPNVSISSQLSQQTISVTDGSGNALIVSSATLTPAVDTRVLRADTLPVTGRVDLVVPSMPAAGTAYTGYLAINTSAGGVWVQVALSVSSSCSGGYGTGVVSAIPASLPISVPSGSTISSQYQVSLYSTVTTAATISAQTANSGNWLSVITPTGTSVVNLTAGGTTTLIVYGIATSLANGQYSGSISVLIGGAVVQTVAVVMTVGSSGSSTVMLAPSPL